MVTNHSMDQDTKKPHNYNLIKAQEAQALGKFVCI